MTGPKVGDVIIIKKPSRYEFTESTEKVLSIDEFQEKYLKPAHLAVDAIYEQQILEYFRKPSPFLNFLPKTPPPTKIQKTKRFFINKYEWIKSIYNFAKNGCDCDY